jgi:antitoxin (DNA-binding transcriptional repressor) of toxin-antitoxin stability system
MKMSWNIAQAKQQFSELVRLCAEEPQAIYNRDRAVATLVNASEFEQFQRWREQNQRTSLVAHFEQGRRAFSEPANTQSTLEPRARMSLQRINAFDAMLASDTLPIQRKKRK